jgi:hypothetical protein
VLSLVERQTRFAFLRVQPSWHSKPIMNSLAEDLGGLPRGGGARPRRSNERHAAQLPGFMTPAEAFAASVRKCGASSAGPIP